MLLSSIDFGPHWASVITRCRQIIANLQPGLTVTLEEDEAGPWLCVKASTQSRSWLLTHPLAAGGADLMMQLDKRQSQRPGDSVSCFNPYDLLRDPQGTLARTRRDF